MKFNLKKATSSLSEIKFRILWLYKLKPEIKILKLRKPETAVHYAVTFIQLIRYMGNSKDKFIGNSINFSLECLILIENSSSKRSS